MIAESDGDTMMGLPLWICGLLGLALYLFGVLTGICLVLAYSMLVSRAMKASD